MSTAEENTDSKPFDSDYYKWSKQISESKKELERLGVDISPTRIEGESPLEQPSPIQGVQTSAWNKAGTWEECDFSKWARSRIQEIMQEATLNEKGFKITISEIDKCDGQATYVFVKGKKRPGFDFNLKLKWKAACDEEDEYATGYICIDDFSDTAAGDYEWSFRADKNDENHTKAKSAVQACKKQLLQLLENWIEEFRSI